MIDLDELERLCREATPGPWRDECGLRVYGPDPALETDAHESLLFSTKHTAARSADSTLCAALRNAAPELIAMARRYQWLCEDHADASTRERRLEILERMSVRSESANSAAIDAAMQEQKR